MFQIKPRFTFHGFLGGCFICGEDFEEDIEHDLYDGNELIGLVCEKCIKSGSQDFPELFRACVDAHRHLVEKLEEMVNKDFALPTEEEYERARKVRAAVNWWLREWYENEKKNLINENKT